MEPYYAALLGAGGAVVPDVLKFINGRFGDAPAWVLKWHYWAGAAALAGLGALVAYFSHPTRIIDALALGYAAPAIVAGLLGRKDGGATEIDTKIPPPGATIQDINRPETSLSLRFQLPTFVRGIRSAWATR